MAYLNLKNGLKIIYREGHPLFILIDAGGCAVYDK